MFHTAFHCLFDSMRYAGFVFSLKCFVKIPDILWHSQVSHASGQPGCRDGPLNFA